MVAFTKYQQKVLKHKNRIIDFNNYLTKNYILFLIIIQF